MIKLVCYVGVDLQDDIDKRNYSVQANLKCPSCNDPWAFRHHILLHIIPIQTVHMCGNLGDKK